MRGAIPTHILILKFIIVKYKLKKKTVVFFLKTCLSARVPVHTPRHLSSRHRINSKDGGLHPGETDRSVAKFDFISKRSMLLT